MLSLALFTIVVGAQAALAAVQTLTSGGQCLQSSGTPADGAAVILGSCNAANAQMTSTGQQWVISVGNNADVQLFGTNFCLDAQADTPGQSIILRTCNNSPSQTWYLTADNRIAITGGNQCLQVNNAVPTTGACAPNIASQAWTQTFLFETPSSTSTTGSSTASSTSGGAGGVVGGATAATSGVTSAASGVASGASSAVSGAASGASAATSMAASGASAATSMAASGASMAASGASAATSAVASGAAGATSAAGSAAGAATSGAGSAASGATSAAGAATSKAGGIVTINQSGYTPLVALAGVLFGALWMV